MNPIKKPRRIIVIAMAIIVAASLMTLGITRSVRRPVKQRLAKPADPQISYDTVLLKKFSGLLQSLDFNRKNFSYTGEFNINDGADTTASIRRLSFLFCRAGKTFYSKVGSNEVLNDGAVNIFIEHDHKKVIVSHETYRVNPVLTGLGQLISKARSEQYELVHSISGSREKIALLNEHHVSCKELSVTYDTLSQKVDKITLRYSDISDPLNTRKDRRVEIGVGRIEYDAHMGKYPSVKEVIKETNGRQVLRSGYAAYELIIL